MGLFVVFYFINHCKFRGFDEDGYRTVLTWSFFIPTIAESYASMKTGILVCRIRSTPTGVFVSIRTTKSSYEDLLRLQANSAQFSRS